jgi:hypothetical protein
VGVKLGEEEREAWLLVEILAVLHEILERLPKPPQYRPPVAIVVIPKSSVYDSN